MNLMSNIQVQSRISTHQRLRPVHKNPLVTVYRKNLTTLLLPVMLLLTVVSASSQIVENHDFPKLNSDSLRKEFDKLPLISMYKDNYFVFGCPLNHKPNQENTNVKFQISLQCKLTKSTLPWNTYLFLYYTQKVFWNVLENSMPMTDLNFNFIRDNIKNDLGKYSFMASSSMFEPEKQKEILSLADDDFKAQENIQRVVKRLENLENVAIGKKFVDFTLKNTEGNDVSLSDYAGKGKYVLVDFWAAWCGPCRQEMPNVVTAYDKYKSKGFEVVGVSFDQEKDKWIQGISDLNMTWPQMSDLMYWESPVVDMYAINGIPHTVLLDKEGTIIEKNLRGEALDAKLAELMP